MATMRTAFHLPSGCPVVTVDIDIVPLSFPFCSIPPFTVPTMAVRDPEISPPDLAPPDICHCITFNHPSRENVHVHPHIMRPTMKFDIHPHTGSGGSRDCCEQEFDTDISIDIPCLPVEIRSTSTIHIMMDTFLPHIEKFRFSKLDVPPTGAVTCLYGASLDIEIPCLPLSMKVPDPTMRINMSIRDPQINKFTFHRRGDDGGTPSCAFDLSFDLDIPCALKRLKARGSGQLLKTFGISQSGPDCDFVIDLQMTMPSVFSGFTGPTGPTGLTGLDGFTGPIGLTGSMGLTGPQGIPGLTGMQGDPGDPGAPGAPGSRGSKGDAGQDGTCTLCSFDCSMLKDVLVPGTFLTWHHSHGPLGTVYTGDCTLDHICSGFYSRWEGRPLWSPEEIRLTFQLKANSTFWDPGVYPTRVSRHILKMDFPHVRVHQATCGHLFSQRVVSLPYEGLLSVPVIRHYEILPFLRPSEVVPGTFLTIHRGADPYPWPITIAHDCTGWEKGSKIESDIVTLWAGNIVGKNRIAIGKRRDHFRLECGHLRTLVGSYYQDWPGYISIPISVLGRTGKTGKPGPTGTCSCWDISCGDFHDEIHAGVFLTWNDDCTMAHHCHSPYNRTYNPIVTVGLVVGSDKAGSVALWYDPRYVGLECGHVMTGGPGITVVHSYQKLISGRSADITYLNAGGIATTLHFVNGLLR